MLINSALIDYGMRRLVRGRKASLAEVARESWEVGPGEEVRGLPAIYPEGSLDRIKALSPWSDWAAEKKLIDGDLIVHRPTMAHLLQDAVVAGPYLYCGACCDRIGWGDRQFLLFSPSMENEIAEAHLTATWTGAKFFGNFLLDSFPLEMIPPAGSTRIGAPTKLYRHAEGYRNLLDLAAPETFGYARIGHLTVYSDFAQNAFKGQRYRQLRERLRARFESVSPPPGIFLKRGNDGEQRQLVNEEALCEILAAQGFDILDPGKLTPEEIARRTLDAPIVISVEGSQLSHIIYSIADRGAFLVIQPPERFAMPYKEFTDRMGMRFGFVVGEPTEDGFSVKVDEILMVMDRLL